MVRNTAMRDYYCRIPSPTKDIVAMPLTDDSSKWVRYDVEKPLRDHLTNFGELTKRLEQQETLVDEKRPEHQSQKTKLVSRDFPDQTDHI